MQHYNEATLSQLPAMRLLHNLGWEYLSKKQVSQQRGGNTDFLLTDVLKERLVAINGDKFAEQDADTAIRELRPSAGNLLESNIGIYNLLINGTNISAINAQGTSDFVPFVFIDWDNIENNSLHFTSEFYASQGHNNVRLDIVMFINGIPIAALECKPPHIGLDNAMQQLEQYQEDVPRLFAFTQLVIAANRQEASYATAGPSKNYWSSWREEEEESLGFGKEHLSNVLRKEVPTDILETMAGDLHQQTGASNPVAPRAATDNKQDLLLISLFSKDRIFDLLRNFILIGDGSKMMALSHQYFVVKSALERVQEIDTQEGGNQRRRGGIIWHTQGSGKSASMILLIKNLKRHLGELDPRVILVSDRVELNIQMEDNLMQSNISYTAASSGEKLRDLISPDGGPSVIVTTVHKFTKAMSDEEKQYDDINTSKNVFLLVDECHRTEYGVFARDMRRLLPNGCYIGLTGTPLLEKYKKSTFLTFGEFIRPTYPIRKALNDNTVVPLLYEARKFNINLNAIEIDKAEVEISKDWSSVEEKLIKKKFSSIFTIMRLRSIVKEIAGDIAEHYCSYVNRYPSNSHNIKAQLVVASKAHAVLYHEALTAKDITSKVIISPPGKNTDEEISNTVSKHESRALVKRFWEKEVIAGYRNSKDYERSVINDFKEEADPQILIVVDKLITGFDAPKNTILYLCKSLKDHTLLQAIARVNRLSPGKTHGLIVDYNFTFDNMREALNSYDQLSGYSAEDLADTLRNIDDLIKEFNASYERIKQMLNLQEGIGPEESWDALVLKMISKDEYKELQSAYKEFMELFAQVASFSAFNEEYKGQFEVMNNHINLGAKLYKYLTGLHNPKSDNFKIASALMEAALNENISADGFEPMGEIVDAYGRGGNPDYKDMNVAEDAEEYTADKVSSDGGRSNYFRKYYSELVSMDRDVQSRRDSQPELVKAMSELIKAALEECNQLSLDYQNKTKSAQELEIMGKKLQDINIDKLQKLLASKTAIDIPGCLEDSLDSVEYYYVVANMLKSKGIDHKRLEDGLCAMAKNTHELLEGDEKHGWWSSIDSEKKIIFNTKQVIWTLEDKYKEFPKDKDANLAAQMLEIARARVKYSSEQLGV